MFDFWVKLEDSRSIGEWSLPQRSGYVVHISLGDISGEMKVRSMVDRVPWVELKCVGTPSE